MQKYNRLEYSSNCSIQSLKKQNEQLKYQLKMLETEHSTSAETKFMLPAQPSSVFNIQQSRFYF